MRVLLTGFEPFAEFTLNPSQKIVEAFASTKVRGLDLFTTILPVDGRKVKSLIPDLVTEFCPTWVVSLGLANGRSGISLERVALNILDFSIPDNAGWQPQDEKIIPAGPVAYFSGLPLRQLLFRLQEAQIPAEISNSAGTFLCNEIFFLFAHLAADWRKFRGGFIHLPCDPLLAQASPKPIPSMPLETMLKGVEIVLAELKQTNLG